MRKINYEKIKLKYVKKYQDRILNLRTEYINSYNKITIERFKELNSIYRKYIIKMVKELADEFKKIYKIDFCITLSGSLGRNSNTLFSDVDINYLTCDNDYKNIIELEDKINFIIQEVLKFRGKDKIHSMVVYLPLISNKSVKLKNNTIYELIFDDGVINVPCRNNSNKLLYETYNSTRNINDVIKYFNSNDTKEYINEWTYCFKFIYSFKYKKMYEKKRRLCYDLSNIQKFKENLIDNINKNNIYLDFLIERIENCKLKKIYKTDVLFNFYKLLAIDFRMEKNIKEFTIDCFFLNSKRIDKRMFVCFYKYLNIIQNLQYILDLEKTDLSSHSSDILDLVEINKIYKCVFKKDNIIYDLNLYKKELYDMCYNFLGGITNG